MLRQFCLSLTVLLSTALIPLNAQALTAAEFMDVCRQSGRPCADVPVLQAYVGGALDLIAVLHEATDYMEPIYCKDPKLLFDVPAIIGFIEQHHVDNAEKNAMLLVVRFLEQYGGC